MPDYVLTSLILLVLMLALTWRQILSRRKSLPRDYEMDKSMQAIAAVAERRHIIKHRRRSTLINQTFPGLELDRKANSR